MKQSSENKRCVSSGACVLFTGPAVHRRRAKLHHTGVPSPQSLAPFRRDKELYMFYLGYIGNRLKRVSLSLLCLVLFITSIKYIKIVLESSLVFSFISLLSWERNPCRRLLWLSLPLLGKQYFLALFFSFRLGLACLNM